MGPAKKALRVKPASFLMKSAGAAALAVAFLGGARFASPAAAATPPPTPPPIDNPAAPQPAASAPPSAATTPIPLPAYGGFPAQPAPSASPGATPTPPKDSRKGLEGVWEVQIQRNDSTTYTHFKLAQDGNTLSGTYLDGAGKRYPLAGSVDGQAIRLIVTLPDGTTMLLEGRLDGTTDMLGMVTTSKEQVPFTAAYRPKEKWIENVNPAPGGIGGAGSGGGYNPP